MAIDRDGEIFREILNFLRKGTISLSRSKKEIEDLLAEAEFYQIESLISLLKEKLSSLQDCKLQFDDVPKIHTACDRKIYDGLKKMSKPVFHLVLGAKERDPSGNPISAPEVQTLRKLYQKYSDVFLFSLELSSGMHTYWIFHHLGKEIDLLSQVQAQGQGQIPNQAGLRPRPSVPPGTHFQVHVHM